MNQVQTRQSVVGRWRVGGLQVPLGPSLMLGIYRFSVLVLHETLFVPVLMYGSETML